jgi:hypothetical protein
LTFVGSARSLAGLAPARDSGGGAPPGAAQAYQYESAAGGGQDAFIGEVDFEPAIANSISLIGNVGAKPELKFLQNGNKVATVGLALQDKKEAETQW